MNNERTLSTWGTFLLTLLLALASGQVLATFAVVNDTPLAGDALTTALREGGYVIFMRHAATEHRQVDRDRIHLDDCGSQRNLSVQGRQQASDIGRAFRQLSLPVGEVWSSPYCRCRDTARLAFGDYQVSPFLHFAIGIGAGETARITAQLQELLATPPRPGSNNVIVSHTANLKEATGIWPSPEGVMVIFRPLGDGRIAYHGMVAPGEWAQLNHTP